MAANEPATLTVRPTIALQEMPRYTEPRIIVG